MTESTGDMPADASPELAGPEHASADLADLADADLADADRGDADEAETDAGGRGRRSAGDEPDLVLLEREGDIAADYLEALLDIADLDGDIDIDVEGTRAAVSIVGADLSKLVGEQGATLEALQELTRLAVTRETGARSRLMLDIGGHRARLREELAALGRRAAEEVAASGQSQRLAPMTPFERKVVHDAVAEVDGVRSESEGEEPQRRVVVLRA